MREAARLGSLLRWLTALAVAGLLAACFNRLDWREFRSAEGRFTVTFPGKVVHEQRNLTSPLGNIAMYMDSSSAGSSLFGVGYTDYPAGYFSHTPAEKVLGGLRDSLVKNIGGGKITEAPVSGEHYQGISVHAEGGGERKLTLDARLLVAGDRMYQVVAIGEAGKDGLDQDALDLYFNSFRITQ